MSDSTVNVEANAAVLGLRRGERATVRQTEMVDSLIRQGKVVVVGEPLPVDVGDEQADSEDSESTEDAPVDEKPAEPVKRASKRAASKSTD